MAELVARAVEECGRRYESLSPHLKKVRCYRLTSGRELALLTETRQVSLYADSSPSGTLRGVERRFYAAADPRAHSLQRYVPTLAKGNEIVHHTIPSFDLLLTFLDWYEQH